MTSPCPWWNGTVVILHVTGTLTAVEHSGHLISTEPALSMLAPLRVVFGRPAQVSPHPGKVTGGARSWCPSPTGSYLSVDAVPAEV